MNKEQAAEIIARSIRYIINENKSDQSQKEPDQDKESEVMSEVQQIDEPQLCGRTDKKTLYSMKVVFAVFEKLKPWRRYNKDDCWTICSALFNDGYSVTYFYHFFACNEQRTRKKEDEEKSKNWRRTMWQKISAIYEEEELKRRRAPHFGYDGNKPLMRDDIKYKTTFGAIWSMLESDIGKENFVSFKQEHKIEYDEKKHKLKELKPIPKVTTINRVSLFDQQIKKLMEEGRLSKSKLENQ